MACRSLGVGVVRSGRKDGCVAKKQPSFDPKEGYRSCQNWLFKSQICARETSLPILFSSKRPQTSLATDQLAVESALADQIETRIPPFVERVEKIDALHHRLGKNACSIRVTADS